MAGEKPAGLWSDLITNVKRAVQSLNNLSQTLGKTFPAWNGATSTSATGGTATALPAQPAGYADVVNPATGQTVKMPFYNT